MKVNVTPCLFALIFAVVSAAVINSETNLNPTLVRHKRGWLSNFGKSIKDRAKELREKTKSVAGAASKTLKDAAGDVGEHLESVGNVSDNIGDAVRDFGVGVKDLTQSVNKKINHLAENADEKLLNAADDVSDGIDYGADSVAEVLDKIDDILYDDTNYKQNVFNGIGDGIKQAVEHVGRQVRSSVHVASNGVRDAARDLGGYFKIGADVVKDTFRDAEMGIGDQLEDVESRDINNQMSEGAGETIQDPGEGIAFGIDVIAEEALEVLGHFEGDKRGTGELIR